MRLRLAFRDGLPTAVRARIQFAFEEFCAAHRVLPVTEGAEFVLHYGAATPPSAPNELALAATYTPRAAKEPAPPPQWHALEHPYEPLAITAMPVFTREVQGERDWLGEIFEWLSAAHEHAARSFDSIGRIAFASSPHGSFDLDPTIPYAAVAMRQLRLRLEQRGARFAPPRFTIAPSHDIDFLPTSRRDSVVRTVKYVGMHALALDRASTTRCARALPTQLRGASARVGALEPIVVSERRAGISATYNFIVARHHRRDANYTRKEATDAIRMVAAGGHEVGLHGSYAALEQPGRLRDELEWIRSAAGTVVGGRMHWLRFFGLSSFLDELEHIGFSYDSTLGYNDAVGYRTGANFPHRLYDFARERPRKLVEVPLAAMDGAIFVQRSRRPAADVIKRFLAGGALVPRGGVSVLWHNTCLAGSQYDEATTGAYWTFLREADAVNTCASLARSHPFAP